MKGNKRQVIRSFAVSVSAIIFLSSSIRAQIITTIAGNGIAGYSGDGGPATAAQFNVNDCIAFDGAGNIYVSDALNHRIRIVNSAGVINTFAGTGVAGFFGDGGPASAAQFNTPGGMARDNAGNIYIADGTNRRIRKISTSGVITTIAGIGTYGYSGDGGQATAAEFSNPQGIAVDGAGNIYVADINHTIRKINASGIISTYAGTGIGGFSGDGGPATGAQVNHPQNMATDAVGNLYIADDLNQRIRKINVSGIITTIAGSGGIGTAAGGYSGDGGAATMALLKRPVGVAVDNFGYIYIADGDNHRIRMINSSGIISTIAGSGATGSGGGGYSGDGSSATSALLKSPFGVSVRCDGDVYVSDRGNSRMRVITYNDVPSFTGGAMQTLTVCVNSTANAINSLLSSADPDMGQTITWSMALAPMHGTASASYTATSTGGTLTPTSLFYTPATGYIGSDSFKVQISDCGVVKDTITIYVTIADCSLGTLMADADVVRIWPNPVKEELIIQVDEHKYDSYTISNTVGHVFMQHTINSADTKVDVSTLPTGLYYMTLNGLQGNVVKKFFKL